MKRIIQIFPVVLAALLQLMPLLKTVVANPAVGSTCAFILRWGIGAAASVGAYDTVSAASNYFTSSSNFTGTVGVFFTNKLTILSSAGDGGAICTLTANGVSTALSNGQTSTNGMPNGLKLKFFDPVGGPNSLYISISGTPTAATTNLFGVDLFYSGSATVHGDFSIKISAGGGSPPSITTQPITGATNLVGSANTLFNVTVNGTAPLSYQWYFNTNTAVSGATNATLALSNVQLTDAGYYRCTVTNSVGSASSANALLTVWQSPSISAQPAGMTTVAGSTAAFAVTASGTPAVNYQWRFNTSTALAGSANALSLPQVRASQAGNYTVVITNSAGAVTSSVAVLGITNPSPPVITSPTKNGGGFQFTFVPVVGLTNTVQANSDLSGGAWNVFSNVPPPVSVSPVTVTDTLGSSNRFYRVMIQP